MQSKEGVGDRPALGADTRVQLPTGETRRPHIDVAARWRRKRGRAGTSESTLFWVTEGRGQRDVRLQVNT